MRFHPADIGRLPASSSILRDFRRKTAGMRMRRTYSQASSLARKGSKSLPASSWVLVDQEQDQEGQDARWVDCYTACQGQDHE